MKVLFLYTEIATYFMAGVQALVRDYGVEVMIIRWPVNAQAPFKFTYGEGITVKDRPDFDDRSLEEFCRAFNPDIVALSGWADKGYVRVAKTLRKAGKPVVCMMDNQWFATPRQRLATLLSPFFIRPVFTHFWVPGLFQYEYARRLGYPREKIRTGMYCSEQQRFFAAYENQREAKAQNYPHRFLYVGRLSPEKGTLNLYHAFDKIADKKGWKLIFIGTGPEDEKMPPTAHIEKRGFVQPSELPALAAEGGCLVFPSLRDAWGVSIHEFAAAGLPLVVTDAAGAITAFVRQGYNGYLFERGNETSLQQALQKIIDHSDEKLREMGGRSALLSHQITPESWAATLMSMRDK
ncbi:MAG: glycosyltransferase family 4 protein [Bacteroidia bacterium]|nr:glycosyltransferase family 4 protein [Bacteroidia bacterium]